MAETQRLEAQIVGRQPASQWYAVWTRSHCEQLVADQLAAKGFHVFLPKVAIWKRRRGTRQLVHNPMFPGYLFLNHPINKFSHVEVLRARGVVRILGERWDRLALIPAVEIESLRRVVETGLPVFAHPYFHEGQRVRITDGPLAGVAGILRERRLDRGLLVLSVTLLQRSLAVCVDCTSVAAA